MFKQFALILAAVFSSSTTLAVAAGQSCPPLVFQTGGYGMHQIETPCTLDLINPERGCLSCPGVTVYENGNPYCQRWSEFPTGQFFTTVPQRRVNGKCVPEYAVQAFAKPVAAKPAPAGSPVRGAPPVTRAAAPPARVAPPTMHFAAPPMHFSAPVIHAAPPSSSGHPGRP